MAVLGLASIRRHKPYPSKKETQGQVHTFPNVLQQDFHISPGKPTKWLTDVTYLPARDRTQYLSCIKDVRDNSIVAYQLSNKNDLHLVMDTLRKALRSAKMRPGIVPHSDQNSQYCSPVYQIFLPGMVSSAVCPGETAAGITVTPPDTHEAFFLANLACDCFEDIVKNSGDEPFHLRVDFWGPHHPYSPRRSITINTGM